MQATSGASFHSPRLDAGGTFEYHATRLGTFRYVCTLHQGMSGTITVTNSWSLTQVRSIERRLVVMTFVEAVDEIVEVAAGEATIDRSGSLLPGSVEVQ